MHKQGDKVFQFSPISQGLTNTCAISQLVHVPKVLQGELKRLRCHVRVIFSDKLAGDDHGLDYIFYVQCTSRKLSTLVTHQESVTEGMSINVKANEL